MSDDKTQLHEYTVVADDGAQIPVARLGSPDGRPVVLVPGMCDNRRIYHGPAGTGLASHLADRGHAVWIVERRGTAGRGVPAGVRRGWTQAVSCDLPAAQRFIESHSSESATWIGHSYGGVIISRALAQRTLEHSSVSGVVLVGSAVDVPLMRSRALRALARARWWNDPVPTHILGFGPEDEYRDQLEDMFDWSDRERRGAELTVALGAVQLPLLQLPGHFDVLSPPHTCDRLARGYGSTDRTRVQIARRGGFASDFGHDTLLMNTRRPRTDVFTAISGWIDAH